MGVRREAHGGVFGVSVSLCLTEIAKPRERATLQAQAQAEPRVGWAAGPYSVGSRGAAGA
jgi:hypothetical protein